MAEGQSAQVTFSGNNGLAIKEAYKKYYDHCLSFAMANCQIEHICKDAVQNAFVYCWANGQQITSQVEVRKYLFESISRYLLTIRDRRSNERTKRVEYSDFMEATERTRLQGSDSNINIVAENSDLIWQLDKAVNYLTPYSRKIYVLYYKYNLTTSEVSKLLSTSRRIVANQVTFIQQFLRAAYSIIRINSTLSTTSIGIALRTQQTRERIKEKPDIFSMAVHGKSFKEISKVYPLLSEDQYHSILSTPNNYNHYLSRDTKLEIDNIRQCYESGMTYREILKYHPIGHFLLVNLIKEMRWSRKLIIFTESLLNEAGAKPNHIIANKARELREQGYSLMQIAKKLGMYPVKVHRICKDVEFTRPTPLSRLRNRLIAENILTEKEFDAVLSCAVQRVAYKVISQRYSQVTESIYKSIARLPEVKVKQKKIKDARVVPALIEAKDCYLKGMTISELSQKFQLSENHFKGWSKKYNVNNRRGWNRKGINQNYSETKCKVIELHQSGLSISHISKEVNLAKSTVYTYIRNADTTPSVSR